MRRLTVLAIVVVTALALTVSSASAFRDRDCSDFPTQNAAQKYFKKHEGPRRDPSRLDADDDGVACEDNP